MEGIPCPQRGNKSLEKGGTSFGCGKDDNLKQKAREEERWVDMKFTISSASGKHPSAVDYCPQTKDNLLGSFLGLLFGEGKARSQERWFEKKFTISSDSGRHPSNVDHVHKEDMKVGNKRVFLNILEEKIIF